MAEDGGFLKVKKKKFLKGIPSGIDTDKRKEKQKHVFYPGKKRTPHNRHLSLRLSSHPCRCQGHLCNASGLAPSRASGGDGKGRRGAGDLVSEQARERINTKPDYNFEEESHVTTVRRQNSGKSQSLISLLMRRRELLRLTH